jgi:hypothetical protein
MVQRVLIFRKLCLDQIPAELKKEVYAVLGLNPDSTTSNICVYADIFNQVKREPGRKYDLTVVAEGKNFISKYNNTYIYTHLWLQLEGTSRKTKRYASRTECKN